jgi:DNA invertase Pin-like site-specific DNA recombinase
MARKTKPKRILTPAQQEASLRNIANSHGRPPRPIDWQRVDDLFWEGVSEEGIAAALSISPRTLQRRRATRFTAPKHDAPGE